MEEKRKRKRYPIDITLTVESLYKQDNITIDSVNKNIEIIDISRSGIGFICTDDLPLDYYFNARLDVEDKKHIYSVIKIIRKSETEDGFNYGCEFVGLADVLSIIIEDYGENL